ncbi:MAG: hypothetical protein RMJ88_16550, partial [Thermogemmata sp.]|nr:hypothetical protein [Thermogemmata sp.]
TPAGPVKTACHLSLIVTPSRAEPGRYHFVVADLPLNNCLPFPNQPIGQAAAATPHRKRLWLIPHRIAYLLNG